MTVAPAPEYTSTMDAAYRGSAVAIGAAASNARVRSRRRPIGEPTG